MINDVTPIFLSVRDPKGCGENNHREYVNANCITRIVPTNSYYSDGYTVYYKTANAAGAERNCSATASKADVEHLLDLIG